MSVNLSKAELQFIQERYQDTSFVLFKKIKATTAYSETYLSFGESARHRSQAVKNSYSFPQSRRKDKLTEPSKLCLIL